MKYQLTPQIAQFDSNGLAITEGWAIVYETDSMTGEFKRATQEFFNLGVGLPAYAYLDKPKNVGDELAIVWLNNQWTYLADHRGKTIYATETGESKLLNEVGDIPSDYTVLAPTGKFDSWDGSKWIRDEKKQKQYDIEQATLIKNEYLSQAGEVIANLQEAIDLDMPEEGDHERLSEWKKYRVILNRLDINNAPNINWPIKPQ